MKIYGHEVVTRLKRMQSMKEGLEKGLNGHNIASHQIGHREDRQAAGLELKRGQTGETGRPAWGDCGREAVFCAVSGGPGRIKEGLLSLSGYKQEI